MKTTMELPDDLMREIKVRAAQENRKLKDVIAELLRRGLAESEDQVEPSVTLHRVSFPLFEGRPAAPGQDATPEVIKQILLDEEVSRYTQQ
jgi:hypothetical protein